MYVCRDNYIDMQNAKNRMLKTLRPEKVLNHIHRLFIGAEAKKKWYVLLNTLAPEL